MVIIDGGKLLVTTAIVCLVVMFFKEWRKTKQCEKAVTWWRLGGGSFLIAMTLVLFIEKPTFLVLNKKISKEKGRWHPSFLMSQWRLSI